MNQFIHIGLILTFSLFRIAITSSEDCSTQTMKLMGRLARSFERVIW
jgi:hypothetical protein